MSLRFSDSETQALIRKTARTYLAERYPWDRLYAFERGETRLLPGQLGDFAEMGWLALLAPESSGGAGASMLEAAVVIEECGYAAVPSPVAVSNVAADLLAHAETPGKHIKDLAAGRALYTLNTSSRRAASAPAPVPATSGGAIRGTAERVPFGEDAGFVLTPLSVDGAPAFALVALAGCEREPIRLLDGGSYARVHLECADATAVEVLAQGRASEALHERCDALVTALSLVELAGMMQRVLEMTAEYISHRVQFGQPIAKFQAARHRAAELLMQAETVRWSAYHALWRFERDDGDTREIWLAKHWAIRAAQRVFEISHLLHGGVGVGTEYPLHLYTQAIAGSVVRAGGMDEMVSRTLGALGLAPGGQRAEGGAH